MPKIIKSPRLIFLCSAFYMEVYKCNAGEAIRVMEC